MTINNIILAIIAFIFFVIIFYGIMKVLVIFLVYDSFKEYLSFREKIKKVNEKIKP